MTTRFYQILSLKQDLNIIAGRAIKSGSWRQFLGPFCRVFCSFERQNASNYQMFVCFILSIYLFIPSCPYEPKMGKNNGLALFWVIVLVWFGLVWITYLWLTSYSTAPLQFFYLKHDNKGKSLANTMVFSLFLVLVLSVW